MGPKGDIETKSIQGVYGNIRVRFAKISCTLTFPALQYLSVTF